MRNGRGVVKEVVTVFVALCLAAAGCSAPKAASRELSRVAKDWSLMMRASQVIPIYPMSEDVQVGDVFVVQTPIGEEVALYESQGGFLPFDNHVMRLDPDAYSAFYPQGVYGVQTGVRPPSHWQFPATSPTTAPATRPSGTGANPGATTRPWVAAPQAAFPTFSFKVQRGGGLTMALPVKSVPVGLGLLGSQEVEGQLTISDAYTYGIDRISLQKQVGDWAARAEVAKFLSQFEPYEVEAPARRGLFAGDAAPTRKLVVNHLRVVSRVYAAQSVNVSMTTAQQQGAQGSVNNPLSTGLLGAATQPAASYEGLLTAINTNLQKATTQPSSQDAIASVKVASISNRSVSLAETFTRPLVIGYVGFDFPILPNGRLGEGIPTRARLEQVLGRSPSERIREWIYAKREQRVRETQQWLQAQNEDMGVVEFMWGVGDPRAATQPGGGGPVKDTAYRDDLRLRFIRDKQIP